MSRYLYGAAVQGIQGFIFQTDKLKEIVGASELVERICTELFARVLYEAECNSNQNNSVSATDLEKALEKDENAILNAAGNIKYIFNNEEDCRHMALIFPKKVMEFAPGITISQSVVELKDNDFRSAVDKLEKNLRTQRNRLIRDMNMGLTGILRSRDTGLPVSHVRKSEYMDSATFHKLFDEKGNRKETFKLLCKKAFGDAFSVEQQENIKCLPLEIKDMTGKNDWLAIIHADGNGLGQVVQKIGSDKEKFREFSRRLDEATVLSARKAFEETVLPTVGENDFIPIRPIVLGGDDLTVICRADLAIPYTQSFLKYFENETGRLLGSLLLGNLPDGKHREPVFRDRSGFLTACAGIAFIKSSFPFHFGYRLAESLCDRAKRDTKTIFKADDGNLPASCIMFYKVQDSYVTDFDNISERELSPSPGISLEFGPYYLDKEYKLTSSQDKALFSKRWTINELIEASKEFEGKEGNIVKSHLRNWLTLLHENPEMAEQKLKRLMSIAPAGKKDFLKKVTASSDTETTYPVNDIMTLHSLNHQTTR